MAPLCAITSIAKTRQLMRTRVTAIDAAATLLVATCLILDAENRPAVTEWALIPKRVAMDLDGNGITLVMLPLVVTSRSASRI